jgi:A/G-specific adenine glycosylase
MRARQESTDQRARVARIQRALLDWYDAHRRDLPWRRTRDPYAVWVSEVMLQQTQVATVTAYYEAWMRRFPDVAALARAREDEVLHAWQGLGYYSRARRLLDGARAVVARHGGRVPDNVEELRALPGIGAYSAGAIASIAYGRPEPVVDGNVTRVLTRLFALRGDPARAPLRRELWQRARALLFEPRVSDFNQALMELGATLCAPHEPRCSECPLAAECLAQRAGIADELPEAAHRPKPTAVHMVAAVVSRRDRVLVTELARDAPRWAGMWQFPTAEVMARETVRRALARAVRDAVGLDADVAELVTVVRHSVTRYRITLDAYRARARGRARSLGCAAFAWKRPSELEALAMPAAHRTIARRLTP